MHILYPAIVFTTIIVVFVVVVIIINIIIIIIITDEAVGFSCYKNFRRTFYFIYVYLDINSVEFFSYVVSMFC
jgi:hypothetical protein